VPIAILVARRFRIGLPPRGERGPRWKEIRRILGIAWPSSAQFVVRISAMLLVNSLAARFFTTDTDQTTTTAIGLVLFGPNEGGALNGHYSRRGTTVFRKLGRWFGDLWN